MGKTKASAKSLPQLLHPGEQLRDRYQIRAIIGGGGFGQIFRGYDELREDEVAIKIEPASAEKRRMKLEHSVLVELRGKPYIPKIRASGEIRGCSFIVMNLLGRNLSELRRRQKGGRKLSIATTFQVAVKLVKGLQEMHKIGYLHRDVKPSNCCIGRAGKQRHDIHILDFGMTRKFRNSDGTVRKAREYVGFRGTVRYASLTVHARKEPGPGDDLISLMYSLIEMVKGELPWTHLRDAIGVEKKKLNTQLETLCEDLPIGFLEFARHASELRYDQMPEYDRIIAMLVNCWPEGVTDETPYDWEARPKKSVDEHTTQKSTEDQPKEGADAQRPRSDNAQQPRSDLGALKSDNETQPTRSKLDVITNNENNDHATPTAITNSPQTREKNQTKCNNN